MLRSRFILLAGFAIAAVSLSACGGSSNSSDGGSAGSTGSGGSGGSDPGNVPPDAGPMKAGDGSGAVLAIHKLYLGDTDRAGKTSSTAWKGFGYNLDGKISTKDSTDLCKPQQGAKPSAIYEDGDGGNDNSFGKNILPIITSLASDAGTQVNDSINKGSFTIILNIEEVGTGDSYNPLTTKLYAGSKLVDDAGMEIAPKWDGTDAWPVVPELLNNGDINNPKVQFASSYVVKDPKTSKRTWVSGSKGDITLNLSVGGFTLGLTVGSALVSTELGDDNKHGTNGTIAGVLDTEQLISELGKVAGSFDPTLCPGSSTFESIAQQIRQASDIMADGSQDPSKTCDGISIGLGFDLDAITLGKVADPSMPAMDPCAM
jgi:hypothetical protein